ncbi:MBL fold metallo-hydrolase [Shimia abyssi]|uniref:Glyoxylase-like metal-dependent hydrolase (Beta-lactamase superfamily II) n=1 Tax=Shimia abyssi TaxID=1662395 RepID=A0A2P8F6F8_9RHOB|nr:MBL fold metallo-hydrolase [Shimia abyssi]PSL17296.1 glyoxylase-like metal-dependent hydrolase (beta-lactamase superfamily II) [Shimia abyssi]
MDADLSAFDPTPGVPVVLEPGVRRVLAPNPSPMTYRGTNTYLIGETDIAVIDPGPDLPEHGNAILSALKPGQRITHILVTHAHLDHSPLAASLSQQTGAAIYAFGGPDAGRSAVMQSLANAGLAGGGEGVDTNFRPDQTMREGDTVRGPDWSFEAIHTPGHFGNHLSFAMDDVCFVGDHVMGWASSLVSPPDGDLTDFMASCEKLRARDWRVFYAGHGAPIENPHERLNWLIAHRRAREAEILSALSKAPASARALAEQIYTETPPALLGAATRNVFAHLVDLSGKSQTRPLGPLHSDAQFERC